MKVIYERPIRNRINGAIDKAKVAKKNIEYIELTYQESKSLLFELMDGFGMYPLNEEGSTYNRYKYGGTEIIVLKDGEHHE